MESLIAFKRAGADGVLTYFAARAAETLTSAGLKARLRRQCAGVFRAKAAPGFALVPEQQLLHAPVQKLGDEKHVRRRTRDFVNPAELLQPLA